MALNLIVTLYKGLVDGTETYVVTIGTGNPDDPLDACECGAEPGYEDIVFAQMMNPHAVIGAIQSGQLSKGKAERSVLDPWLAEETTEQLWTAECSGSRVN